MNKNSLAGIFLLLFIISCSSGKREKVDISRHFWAPNSFSPNGDQLNEAFNPVPRAYILFTDYHITLYGDNLQVLWESRNINEFWDPLLAGQNVPPGAYEYVIDYTASEDSVTYYDYTTSSTVNLMM